MNNFRLGQFSQLLGICAVALGVSSCAPQTEEAEEFRLPISINEVMASLINHSADPIWVAAWRNPQTDEDWRELEHLARQLQLGGSLITIPGTGPVDTMWTGRESWHEYSMALADSAGRAVNAARSKDVELIARAGDEIVEICESCHRDFKPDLPTMNIYGELSPTAEDL
ncbi:MAG: hypothetical protein O2948_13365 [Proteobacteria bacterium]|nr:hypothetical protein [Pseudomonadota bacterium]MDA0926792.1 hypothetical protein [Pseudomonadota bacterium]